MQTFIEYDHNCPNCDAYYIPFNQNTVCPNCGFAEDERFDYIERVVDFIENNLEDYSWIKPDEIEANSFADHVLMLTLQSLEFYAYKRNEFTIDDALSYFFNKVQFKDQEYLRFHIQNISKEVFKKIQFNEKFLNWLNDFEEILSNEEIQDILNEDLKEFNSDNSEDYTYRAFDLIIEKEYDSAVNLFKKAIHIDSKYDYAYFGLALALRGLQQFNEAIDNLNIAIQIKSDIDEYYNLRSECYLNLDDIGNALSDVNHSINLFSQNPKYYNNRGICYRRDGLFENAISDFNHSIHLDPDYDLPYFNLAVLYSIKGEWEKSIDFYEKSLKINESNDKAWYYLSLDALEIEDHDLALKSLSNAINLDPENDFYYYERALIYREIGSIKRALIDVDNALELFKSDDYYNLKGLIHVQIEDYQTAVQNFHQAIKVNPQNYNAYVNMFECQILLGLFKESLINLDYGLDNIKDKSLRVTVLFYKIIVLTHQKMDYKDSLEEFKEKLLDEINLNWDFSLIKTFIKDSILDDEDKKLLLSKLTLLERFN